MRNKYYFVRECCFFVIKNVFMRKFQVSFHLIFILSQFAFIPNLIIAQNKASVNNGFYITYPQKLMTRVYLSQKYVPLTISSNSNDIDLNYKTTSKLNLGIGATVNGLSLNLSYGFNFLNPGKGRGKTKGLDLQFRLYPHKWAIDFLGTFIKGYYLESDDNNGLHLTDYYVRPDLKREVVGLSAFRVANPDKFSYRAAITQNEWQTKSAGSLLFGGEIYYGLVKGDSALVPKTVSSSFEQAGINKINFISAGPGIGYAYTLVVDKNFFITGSAIGSLDFNFSTEEKEGSSHTKSSILPGAIYRGAIGYNSSTWSISAHIIGNALYVGSASSSKDYFLPTGNIRFIVARKIGGTKH
jgi:hypothetical protein